MRGYTGTLAGIAFEDGSPVTEDEPPDVDRLVRSIVGYAKRHGLRVVDDRLMVIEAGDPPPAAPEKAEPTPAKRARKSPRKQSVKASKGKGAVSPEVPGADLVPDAEQVGTTPVDGAPADDQSDSNIDGHGD